MAYRADIEIAVRGAQDLKRLQNEISTASKLVNQLNQYIETFGGPSIVRSIRNLKDVVGEAATAFNKAALGTDEATIAAKKYIEATAELNAGLRERKELLSSITEQERKARLARSGIVEVTQYGGPIGPGQASPVALRSELRGRTQQILDERKGAKELELALLELEERRRTETNAMLDAKAASVALRAEREKEVFLAGKTQFAEPIGPGQVSPVALSSRVEGRIQSILQERQGRKELNAVLEDQFEKERQLQNNRLDEKAAQVQAALDKQTAATAETAAQTAKLNERTLEFTARTDQAARAARAQTAEYLRQQRILKELRKTQATAPAGGFPVEGPMASPGFRGMQRNVGKFGENLALGAGFPLLFGGGPGAVAGSVLGSFVGTGFGGQILGGAIGQVLDQTLIKIKDIGNAIKQLNFDTLTESGIKFSAEVQSQLDLLLQVGDALTAQKIVSQEVARETGTLPGVTEDVANSVNILNDSWRKTINAVSTTAGIIAAPLAVALAGVLETVNSIFRVLNGVLSLIGTGIKTAAEFVIELIGGKDAIEFINNGIDKLNSGLSEATARAAEFRNTINQAVVQSSIELRATKALTPGVTTEDKLTNINVQKQKELDLLFQDEIDARIKIRQENAKASIETVEGLIKQNTLLFKNKRENIEINAQRQITAEIQRNQAELDRRAAQELERQRKELERIAKKRMEQMDTAQRNYVLAEAEIGILTAVNDEAKAQAEYDKARVERMYSFSELLKNALSDEERESYLQTQYLNALGAQVVLDKKLLDIQKEQTAELYKQLDASGILNDQVQKRLKRGAMPEGGADRRIGIMGFTSGLNLDPNDKAAQKYEEMKQRLKELSDPINMAEQGALAIGDAFSTAFQGIISGTQTTQEALSNFFKGVGDAFISMATEIIAQMVVMFAFKQLLGLFGGGGNGGMFKGAGPYAMPKGPGFAEGFSLPKLYAEGGFVTGPTNALIGEGGEPEYVIPASKMRSAMGRYASGARGSSVIPTGSDGGEMGGTATMAPAAIDVRYTVERINSVDYVTADQFRQGMQQAAAQGAARGEQATIRRLQQSRSTRSRLGIS